MDRLEWFLLAAICIVLFASLLTNTWAPYHVDSAIYVQRVVDGRIGPGWRGGMSLILLPFLPLAWVFNKVAMHIAFVLLSYVSFLAFYYFFYKQYDRKTALILLLLFASIPATLATLNIGKEELFLANLALLSVLIYQLRPALSGFLFSLTFSAKEVTVFLAPLLLPHIYQDFKARQFRRMAEFVLGGVVLLPYTLPELFRIFTQSSPYMGSFVPFKYFSVLLPAILSGFNPLVLLLLLGLGLLSKERRWLPYALLVLFYLSNVTTATYRNAVTLFPLFALPAAGGIFHFDEKKKWLLALFVVGLSLWNLWTLFPTLYFRGQTNLPGYFATAYGGYNANYVLTMDFCGLFQFYSNLKCITHPPNPSPEDLNKLFGEIRGKIGEGVLVSPDFFAYADRSLYERFSSEFNLIAVGDTWFEDYHAVRIYPTPSELGCSFVSVGKETILGVEVQRGTLFCGRKKFTAYSFMGRILVGVRRVPVLRVIG